MAKKGKTKKDRLDVFYKRAKAAGYRARASYKLIQLNKKYNFLQTARVCIDLCAAPGSWMQVASKYMPVSSIIIGVDRHDIAPIPNTISINGDITTEKLRSDLKAQIKTWKADVVLHDGAPNMGQNWLHDAYQQNLLVLHSFKLACEFLKKGGVFVTKVFRSKDHLSLEYIFKKLFKRVETTKPIASRFESAEIFVVCLGFLAPDKIDPQFFDAKYVFQGLEDEPSNKINLLKPEKPKKKAEGYEEGITMLFKRKNISEFIMSSEYIDVLEVTNQFEWDLLAAKESSYTTPEIIEICKDIKVLGRKELQALIKWRKNIKAELELLKTSQIKSVETVEEVAPEADEIEKDLEELEEIQKEITDLQSKKMREDKQHLKKVEKKKRKIDEKLKLRLMIPGDPGPREAEDLGLFNINTLDKINTLDNVVDQSGETFAESDSEPDDDVQKYRYISKGSGETTIQERDRESSDSEDSDAEGLNMDVEPVSKEIDTENFDDDTGKCNPLTTDLVGDFLKEKKERKAEKWFANEIFGTVQNEELENFELDNAVAQHQVKGGKIRVKLQKEESVEPSTLEEPRGVKRKSEFVAKDAPESDEESGEENDDTGYEEGNDDSESDSEEEEDPEALARAAEEKRKRKNAPKLNSVGKALATKMLKSKKTKRDIYDDSWNRYMQGDEEDLPEFFKKSEERFNCPPIIVEKEDLKLYQEKNKSVDARTIKKVVEAKARKQRKLKKRMSRARKKAEVIASNFDMSNREKAMEMKKVYAKAASVLKKKETKYVVMKKHFGGSKPKSIKGPSRMVDRRLKKDKRAVASREKKTKGRKS